MVLKHANVFMRCRDRQIETKRTLQWIARTKVNDYKADTQKANRLPRLACVYAQITAATSIFLADALQRKHAKLLGIVAMS